MTDLTDRRILVVEDEYFIAEDIAQALRQRGATVVGPTGDAHEAIALLNSGRLDAAVIDVNLRGGMAYPVAAALRGLGVPFLFATGYDQGHIHADYADVPRTPKPLNWRILLRSVSELAGGARD